MLDDALKLMLEKDLPARSPYSPIRQHSNGTTTKVSVTAVMTIFLFVFRYWKRVGGCDIHSEGDDDDDESRGMVAFWKFLERRIREVFVKVNTKSRSILSTIKSENINGTVAHLSSSLPLSFRSILKALASSMNNTYSSICDGGASSTSTSNIRNECNDARREIRDNICAIQSVLNYWFGQHPPDVSQKLLWMIQTTQHREKVDAEISTKFEYLLRDLSSQTATAATNNNNNNHNDVDDGESSIAIPSNHSLLWKQWVLDPDGIYGATGKIAAIIVLDQFSRHIQRHYETIRTRNDNDIKKSDINHLILLSKEHLDRLALETAKLLVRDHSDELDCGMIPLPMQIFALMPYRHAGTMDSVRYVQKKVEEIASLQEQNEAMIGRFRKATNRRLAVLQDEQRRTGTSDKAMISMKMTNNNNDDAINAAGADGEGQSRTAASTDTTTDTTNFSDDDILETFPFNADMAAALIHPIHKTIVQFLSEQGIHPATASSKGKGCGAGDGKTETNKDAIIISLSGGVDSMVIVRVLAHLKMLCGYDHLIVHAVHIDYANRPESGAEADYVRRYCEENLGTNTIEFTCRLIGEVTRGVTSRDDYERIAREIRYDSYRDTVAKAKSDMGICSKEEQRDTIVGVMLGHHRGDLRENVLSNSHKGCGPLDLSGMTEVSKNDGITIYRPLLPLEKSFVLDYAHKFGVPYFKDTTPHWSTR
jgi:tRNA(Ile)-lysidine synthetase-like protein